MYHFWIKSISKFSLGKISNLIPNPIHSQSEKWLHSFQFNSPSLNNCLRCTFVPSSPNTIANNGKEPPFAKVSGLIEVSERDPKEIILTKEKKMAEKSSLRSFEFKPLHSGRVTMKGKFWPITRKERITAANWKKERITAANWNKEINCKDSEYFFMGKPTRYSNAFSQFHWILFPQELQ